MHGKGPTFLAESFDILLKQTFKDFNIVISDNAQDDSIKKVCDQYRDRLDIYYCKNPGAKEFWDNMNNALRNANGKICKILLMDDFLYNENSLKTIADNFDLEKDHWLATGCTHTRDAKIFINPHYPIYHNYIHFGRNTIGTPSVVAVKNQDLVFMQPEFKYSLNDCDYYKEMGKKFGKPKIINEINVVVRLHEHQITNTTNTTSAQFKELFLMLKKHNTTLFSHPEILLAYIKIWIKKILAILKK